MHVLVRTHPYTVSLELGLLTLTAGVIAAWSALRRWRATAPIRCASVVGLSAGFAGAGLFMSLVYLLGLLLTPVSTIQGG